MLRTMLLCLPAGVGFYILFVFVVSYLQTFVHVPGREALEVNTLSMIGYLGWTLLGGALSDRLARKPVAVAAMAGLLLFAWPLFDLLDHPRVAFMLSAQLCMAASLGLYFGQSPAPAGRGPARAGSLLCAFAELQFQRGALRRADAARGNLADPAHR
jgi:MHS family proline/betaine transporter-like MFS transporter